MSITGGMSFDATDASVRHTGFAAIRRRWAERVGSEVPPRFGAASRGGFRIRGQAGRLHDAVIADLYDVQAIRTEERLEGETDQVRVYVVRRGAWTVDPDEHGETSVPAGQFHLRHVGRPTRFLTAPHTTVKLVLLPAATLAPLLGNRMIDGSLDLPELRLLVAHTNMINETMTGLGPAGLQAAHSTLLELAKAVIQSRFDDVEPRLAPALAHAAKDLADDRLADPELSPETLARALNVSVRTLQRAFAAAGEPATAYIRRRRLEEARLALTAPGSRPSVSELAAYWQFADSSHFTRAFKKHYGRTPTEYARSASPR